MTRATGRHRDTSNAQLALAVLVLLLLIAILTSVAIFREACDVVEGWPCVVFDDGQHDGQFNWRHGVIPF